MSEGKALTSEPIQLVNWRLSFANLATAKAYKEGQPKQYSATFLGDPSKPRVAEQIARLKDAADRLIKEKWGDRPSDLKVCFGLADENRTKRKYAGYPGMFYVSTAANWSEDPEKDRKPKVYNRRAEIIAPGDPEWPINGYRVNTFVSLWTQDNKWGVAIRGNLRQVQFYRKDTPFSGGAEGQFASYEDEPADDDVEGQEDASGFLQS